MLAVSDDVPCSIEGCENAAQRNGLCWGHERRRARDQRLGELRRRIDGKGPKARWARIQKAAIEFANDTEPRDGETEAEAEVRAKWKFRDALKRYFAELNPAVYRFRVDNQGRVKFTRHDGKPLKNPKRR